MEAKMMKGNMYDFGDREVRVLTMTRAEVIADLEKSFKEQNDLDCMNDAALAHSWKRLGIHAGTWDWDEIMITE